MKQQSVDLLPISIDNLSYSDTRSYFPLLGTAEQILRLIQKRFPDLEPDIQEAIDIVRLAEEGYETRPNVIKKLEKLYEKIQAVSK